MQAKKHLFKIHRYGYPKIRIETLSEILKFTIDLNGFYEKLNVNCGHSFYADTSEIQQKLLFYGHM